MELQYRRLKILSQFYSCQDSEFQFRETHQLTMNCCYGLAKKKKTHFLCMPCPKISLFFLFKDGAELRRESFSCKQSLHTLSPGANGFTFLTTFHLMLMSMFLFFLISKRDREVLLKFSCVLI